jgi:hypothetical protein
MYINSEDEQKIKDKVRKFKSELYQPFAKTKDGTAIELGKTYWTGNSITLHAVQIPSDSSSVNDTPYYTKDSIKWTTYTDGHYGGSYDSGYEYDELWSSEEAFWRAEIKRMDSQAKDFRQKKIHYENLSGEYKEKLNAILASKENNDN